MALSVSAEQPRYRAVMRDGSVAAGEMLEHVDDGQPLKLDGRNLLAGDSPLRTLYDTTRTPERPESYVELANGDVLAGRVVEAAVGERAFPLPDHLKVEHVRYTGLVRVRLDWVRRIVSGWQPRSEWRPGFLRLADGRSIQCRGVDWKASGVDVLTDEGVLPVGFGQVAELHTALPVSWQPPWPAAAWLDVEPPAVVRTVTADGQAFTYPRSMVSTEFDKKARGLRAPEIPELYTTRPPWAFDLLLIDRDAIAWQTYFDAGEVPLSLLPVVEEATKAGLHYFPWRRDRGVRGGILQCGDLVSGLGIGMHAWTRLAFELPPQAKTFTSRVGLSRWAGEGGCVHCRVWRDRAAGEPLWERRFLTGADGVQQIGPLDVSGAAKLILEVDLADEGRPKGADPLDIRDSVDWLMPIVHVEPAKDDVAPFAVAVPEIEGWSISADSLKRIVLRPFWLSREDRWGMAMATGREPLVLSQKINITLENAWLRVRATCDNDGDNRTIRVRADGRNVGSTMNGDLQTFSRNRYGDRVYILNGHAQRATTVEVVADPYRKSKSDLAGVVWDWLRLEPLIQNLPAGGEPIRPDVPLISLSPIRAVCKKKPIKLAAGRLTSGETLNVRDWPLENGFGVPTGSEIVFNLDPSWRAFVAVIGLAEGWKGAGPYQILLDDRPHWSSERVFARNDPGAQISVSIPPGHKTITLRLLGDECEGAWAHAGFMK